MANRLKLETGEQELLNSYERGEWQSRITPAAAIGSLLGWIAQGVPIILAGDHGRAGRYVSRLLFTAARRRWREARVLAVGMADEERERPTGAGEEGLTVSGRRR